MGSLTSIFIAKMEHLLALYARPYDPRYPVVCFDERPCFLIGEVMRPFPVKAGQVAKEHYAYEKNGSCSLLAAIEPLTGERLAQVHTRRTKREYTLFFQALAARYPHAAKIQVVQDNLNTHNVSSFYEYLTAEEAFALAQRFEFHYTPKSASWLNMIEIEFSALARGCLHQRIPTQDQLEQEVLALVQERHDQRIRINWQFSIEDAREKFQKHYVKIRADKTL
ncbi:MAG: IS630 family transposase [Cyanobacteria bacterium P01_F01_bin.53]